MLKNVPAIIPPDLLKALCEMGHGDTIVIANGNFPSAKMAAAGGAALVRCDGVKVPELLRAVLELMPLDTFVETPVALIGAAKGLKPVEAPIWEQFRRIVAEYDARGASAFRISDRYAFYEEAKASYVIAPTSDSTLYANIILTKGVVV